VKFSELLKKIGGLITDKRQSSSVIMPMPHYVRDQKQVDAHLAKMGHTIERRNQHVPFWSPNIFDQSLAETRAFNLRRPGTGRRFTMDSNTKMLGG
jgi:hypothetical protein